MPNLKNRLRNKLGRLVGNPLFGICKCGNKFQIIATKRTKYCSRECYLRFHKEDSFNFETHEKCLCKNCGKEFNNWKCHESKFCSSECYFDFKHKSRTGQECKCEICGKSIYIDKNEIVNKKHHFCSKPCYAKYQSLLRGNQTGNWKNHNNLICETCGKEFTTYNYLKDRRFCSQECFINARFVTHIIKYKDNHFRSSYEANFAKWLDLSGIKWEYEQKRFLVVLNSKETKYIPDFYLSEFDCYIEVKGYWYHRSKQKMEQFRKQYPDINIEIFDQPRLLDYGVIKK